MLPRLLNPSGSSRLPRPGARAPHSQPARWGEPARGGAARLTRPREGRSGRSGNHGFRGTTTCPTQVSTVGAFLLSLSVLPFLYNVWVSRQAPAVAVHDPWGWGRSLEWATTCPPPRHNFADLPRIRSESPAFDLHHPEVAAMELDQNPREAGGADESFVDAPDQSGRAETVGAEVPHTHEVGASRGHSRKRILTALFVLAGVGTALVLMLLVGIVVLG